MASLDHILSDQSFFGRGGDTEMRMVGGEMSHVNPKEAAIIDMYGSQGEKIVESMGSGTINPYTGKKEYQALTGWALYTAMAAIGTAVLGGVKQYSEGVASMNKAKIDKSIGQDTISGIEGPEGSMAKLDEDRDAQIKLAEEGFVEQRGNVAAQTGMQLEKAIGQMDISRGKSNIVSGTIDAASDRARGILAGDLGRRTSTLWGNLAEKMGGIDRWFAGEEGKLELQRQRAQAQIDLAEKQEKGIHLGEERGIDLFTKADKAIGGKPMRFGQHYGWG